MTGSVAALVGPERVADPGGGRGGTAVPEALRALEAVLGPVRVPPAIPGAHVKVGVDLGTAYTVLTVLDADDRPMVAAYEFADVVRDGVVTDFVGAVDLLRRLKRDVETRLGVTITAGHGAFPPGVPESDVRAVRHVIEACDMACTGLVDEPTAANAVLGLRDGAVVDVGGGSTGIAVVRDGAVVHTADEATGGTHLSLVIAGALRVPFDEAEDVKKRATEQPRLYPLVRPVMEKVATIVARNTAGHDVPRIWLVGGSAAFPGFAAVVAEATGIPTDTPPLPLLVTPLGIARTAPALPAGP